MAYDDFDDIEVLWEALLSREAARVHGAWASLVREERLAVYAHLKRMASEPGWPEPQRQSAQAALDALGDLADAHDD